MFLNIRHSFCTLSWMGARRQIKDWELNDIDFQKTAQRAEPLDLNARPQTKQRRCPSHLSFPMRKMATQAASQISDMPAAPLPIYRERCFNPSDVIAPSSPPQTLSSTSVDGSIYHNWKSMYDSGAREHVNPQRVFDSFGITEEWTPTTVPMGAQIAYGMPSLVIAPFLDPSLGRPNSKPSKAPLKRPTPSEHRDRPTLRTRLLGTGPVFGREKVVLEPRLLVSRSTVHFLDTIIDLPDDCRLPIVTRSLTVS